MRHYIIIILTIFGTNFQSYAQQDLHSRLEGKTNYYDIVNTVDKYYEGHDDNWRGINGDDPKIKHWKRWEWYTSSRIGRNGEFVNFKDSLQKAIDEVEKKFPKDTRRDVNGTWQTIGPSSTTDGIGRADRIAFHPTDPDIYYVGTPNGGLWRTIDGGTTWEPLTDHLPSIGISGIVVDYDNPSTIYILTGDGDSANNGGFVFQFGYARKSIGVLKSTDSGATWKKTGILDEADYLPFKLVQSPVNPNHLLAATSLGIYKSTNGGGSWSKTHNGKIFDIEYKPGSGTTVYASGKDKIYYSIFGGSSWVEAELSDTLDSPRRIELAVTPHDDSYVYALIGDTDKDAAGTYGGTFRSTDSGQTYQLRSTTPNVLGNSSGFDDSDVAAYALTMAVSPINKDQLATGCKCVYTSFTGGAWFPGAVFGYHGDIHQLAYNPLNNKLYNCNDGGVDVSDDDGETWTNFYDGFETSQMYHMTGTPLDDDYFLGGLQDNGVKVRTANHGSWAHAWGSDGFDVAYNPIDKTEFYATVNQGALRFWNNGSSSDVISPPIRDWFGTIRTHVSDPNIVFYGTDTIQISYDKGLTWTNSFASGTWALETCPSNSNRLYAAGGDNFNVSDTAAALTRTDDLGLTWDTISTNAGFPGPNNYNKITDIGVNPGNSNSVYVTFGGMVDGVKVFRSGDAGGTWENYSGSLPNIPINCIVINEAADQVYIGTDIGVFYRHSSMNDWMPFNNKLPNVPVTDLFIDENNDEIYASTFGRGAWRNDLVDGCPNNMSLGGNFVGNHFYQAAGQITTDAHVKGGLNTQVFFKAGERVIIEPGFRAYKHTLFKAYTGGCGEGDIPE